ncbi:hypothetical protein CKAN_02364500 [Cinnamomum micranthum f. kanehirae]|uniref:Uncharacterized protein n=1 Tax=Cinnamomum micranthum f. kanehirae TaxID=337451 RepID=A0A3S3N206_9MAGN|nr:hypothetical protein CKAN_02364500 [Cinnamomum micranthum f. kanehirae]
MIMQSDRYPRAINRFLSCPALALTLHLSTSCDRLGRRSFLHPDWHPLPRPKTIDPNRRPQSLSLSCVPSLSCVQSSSSLSRQAFLLGPQLEVFPASVNNKGIPETNSLFKLQ